jgi:hypothetical protein
LEHFTKIKGEIRVFVQFSANIHGLIDRTEVIRGYNKDFDKEAIRVVKSIPQWDILYSHGKFIRMNYILPVIFNSEKKGNYRAKKLRITYILTDPKPSDDKAKRTNLLVVDFYRVDIMQK